MSITISMTLENLEVNFNRGVGSWTMHCYTADPSENAVLRDLTDSEVGAILALAVGLGEEHVDAIGVQWLYKMAEPVVSRLPDNLRPIP